jgi:hypothetical protein
LSYIFDVRSKFSDYLPVISIISLALLQLSLSFGRKVAALEIVIAATPLALCGATMMFSSIAAVNPTGIEYLWHPAVLLAVTGLALLWLARVNNALLLLWVCAGYALGVMLTAKPTGQLISLNLNWDFTGGVLVVGLLLFGVRKRNPALCFAAGTVTALGLPMQVVGTGAHILRGPGGTDTYYDTSSVTLGGGEAADVIIDTAGVTPGTYFLYTTNLNYLSNNTEDYGGMMTEIRIN